MGNLFVIIRSVLVATLASAEEAWPCCKTDIDQIQVQLSRYGVVVATDALVDGITESPVNRTWTTCSILCHTDCTGPGKCTWDRGNWGDTLSYHPTKTSAAGNLCL